LGRNPAHPAPRSQLRQVQAAKQQLQFGSGEQDGLLAWLRPALKRAFVKPFSQDAHAAIVPPENFEQVTSAIGEHPQIAAPWLGSELLLDQRIQTAVPAPEVNRLGGQVDLRRSCSQADHGGYDWSVLSISPRPAHADSPPRASSNRAPLSRCKTAAPPRIGAMSLVFTATGALTCTSANADLRGFIHFRRHCENVIG
jgi:hypothetical protein